jgi:hypothetical protein
METPLLFQETQLATAERRMAPRVLVSMTAKAKSLDLSRL